MPNKGKQKVKLKSTIWIDWIFKNFKSYFLRSDHYYINVWSIDYLTQSEIMP